MIDTNFSTRMVLHALRAEKNAYIVSLEALKKLPMAMALQTIQEWLEACEDREISAERKLEGLTPKHSSVL